MKKIYPLIAILVLLTINCNKKNTYQLTYIYDYEEVLTDDQKLELDKLFVDHEKKTSNEITLVTTGDYGEEENIELYSLDFMAKHPIGKNGKNNGVLIVFSQSKSEVRITPGTGLKYLDESGTTAHLIKEVMIPKFEKKEYYEGLLDGCKQLIDFLETNK